MCSKDSRPEVEFIGPNGTLGKKDSYTWAEVNEALTVLFSRIDELSDIIQDYKWDND